MGRFSILIYSILSYITGLVIVVYYAGFLVDMWFPKTINSGDFQGWGLAIITNIMLLLLFGLQHSVMARQWFKKWIKKQIPPAAERSTYILMTSVVLTIVCALWQPLPQTVFSVKGTFLEIVLYTLYGFGWFVCLFSTFLINHFDLFGLRQAWKNWRGQNDFNYSFCTPLFYKLVRHPIYTGWLMVHWFTPEMSLGHLLFAVVISVYIYIAIVYEERDLTEQFGDKYKAYVRSTPKLIPALGKRKK